MQRKRLGSIGPRNFDGKGQSRLRGFREISKE